MDAEEVMVRPGISAEVRLSQDRWAQAGQTPESATATRIVGRMVIVCSRYLVRFSRPSEYQQQERVRPAKQPPT